MLGGKTIERITSIYSIVEWISSWRKLSWAVFSSIWQYGVKKALLHCCDYLFFWWVILYHSEGKVEGDKSSWGAILEQFCSEYWHLGTIFDLSKYIINFYSSSLLIYLKEILQPDLETCVVMIKLICGGSIVNRFVKFRGNTYMLSYFLQVRH